MTTDTNRERKAALLEDALASLRQYKAAMPLAKRQTATGAKADALISKLEALANRFASR